MQHAPHMRLDWLQKQRLDQGRSYRNSPNRTGGDFFDQSSRFSNVSQVQRECMCVCVCGLQMTSERRQLCSCSSSHFDQIRRKILDTFPPSSWYSPSPPPLSTLVLHFFVWHTQKIYPILREAFLPPPEIPPAVCVGLCVMPRPLCDRTATDA